jgi:hypothetical protein
MGSMTGSINPDDYTDPNNPPPGYAAVDCPGCSSTGPKPRHLKMAVGPVPGVGLDAGNSTSFCRVCRGRGWVWYRVADLEI